MGLRFTLARNTARRTPGVLPLGSQSRESYLKGLAMKLAIEIIGIICAALGVVVSLFLIWIFS